MIEINETFLVNASPAEVYAVLADPEAVVECVQGAAINGQNDDGSLDVSLLIKFSAMRIAFKGRVELDLDPDQLQGTVRATGKDGQGGTKFISTAQFRVVQVGDGTQSEVHATGNVNLTGRMASAIASASNAIVRRMTAEFVAALSLRCASQSTLIGGGPAGDVTPGAVTREPASRPGVLLLHGLGGSPNTMRAWGDALAADGALVSIPRLPGHGTRWQDLRSVAFSDWVEAADSSFRELSSRCSTVVVMGLSLGGLLALRLAEEHGTEVAGLVLVNPLLTSVAGTPGRWSIPRWVRRSIRIAESGDARDPRPRAAGYQRMPVRTADEVRTGGRIVLEALDRVTNPILLVTSEHDRVVRNADSAIVAEGLKRAKVEQVRLLNSDHLVPLGSDAPQLFARSARFVAAAHDPRSVAG